jgi:hypothetical protein
VTDNTTITVGGPPVGHIVETDYLPEERCRITAIYWDDPTDSGETLRFEFADDGE